MTRFLRVEDAIRICARAASSSAWVRNPPKELRADDANGEPRRVSATDNPGMVRRGEEVQPVASLFEAAPRRTAWPWRSLSRVGSRRSSGFTSRRVVGSAGVFVFCDPLMNANTSRSGGGGFSGF